MFKRILTYSILTLIALGGFFGNIVTENYNTTNSMISLSYETNAIYAADPCTNGKDAAGNPCTTKSSAEQVDMYNKMIDGINMALAVLSAMITPIILFVGWLMSPDWTSGDLFGLRTPMYALWVTVSNIVYFIYAILLILIALGTMFGQDKFSYKVMLPKLALGILMVPFTWWFVQWTISIATVVTASVMTIPAETISKGDSKWFTDPTIPKIISVDNTGSGADTNIIDCSIYPSQCQSPKEFLAKASGMYGPLIVYGYSVFKFEKITRLDSKLDVASAALKIVHTSIISTIMFAVFGLLTLALASMLLVRAMKLWMYAIFAPLFTFRFVAGSNLMGGDDDSFSIKEFIGLAFVPAIVGLTLSFGLIIINAVQGPTSNGANSNVGQECDLSSSKGCVIEGIMGNTANSLTRTIEKFGTKDAYTRTIFKYADIEFYFLGKASNQTNSKSTSSGAIDALGGMFGTLIVDVLALVFIWMAFMAAKNVSKAVKIAVEPFEKIGTQVGTLAKSLPKYTPLPLPGGSISGMGKVTDGLARIPEVRAQERFDKSDVGKWIKEQSGQTASADKIAKTKDVMNHGTKEEFQQNMRQYRAEDNKTLVEALNKDPTGLTKQINSLMSAEKEIAEKIRDPKAAGELDGLKAQAILSGKSAIDIKDKSIGQLRELINDISKSTTGGSSGASGVTGAATKVNDSTINLNNITDKILQIKTTDGGEKVIFEAKDAEKIKGKSATMTEEGFRESLISSGTMTERGITDLIDKMKAANKDFFKK